MTFHMIDYLRYQHKNDALVEFKTAQHVGLPLDEYHVFYELRSEGRRANIVT